jgi:hypothetical protein
MDPLFFAFSEYLFISGKSPSQPHGVYLSRFYKRFTPGLRTNAPLAGKIIKPAIRNPFGSRRIGDEYPASQWEKCLLTKIMDIRITVGSVTLDAELNETPTARKVAAVLPLDIPFNTWGDEIYFEIPVEAELDESAQEEVAVADLGYWPTGRAFCIFFGPTPMSTAGKIIPASAVNVIGRVTGEAVELKGVMDAGRIVVEANI